MKEYEIIIETINPCGGDRHSQQEIIEANIESPEAFVKEKGRFPIIDKIENPDGGVVIVTGDGKGYMVRYTFTPSVFIHTSWISLSCTRSSAEREP